MQEIDILCVGNAVIDIFLMLTHPDDHYHESDHGKEFCFSLGAKIPVKDSQFYLGGDACNVSVGLSRLGLRSAIVAETGDDMFAKRIVEGLQQEQVSLEFFKQTPNSPATFSVNLVFQRDRTILSRHIKRTHDISFTSAHPKWVYLTSLGEEWQLLYTNVSKFIKENNINLAFNPGSTQLQKGRESFANILQQTSILFVNKEEAEKIAYGEEHMNSQAETMEQLLKDIQKLGPKIVSVTDGEQGSYALDAEGKFYTQGIIPGDFVQKTGVGDAYAAGFLASLFYNENNIQQAMLWGATNAASVIGHMGAQGGLLKREELTQKTSSRA